VEKIKPVTAQVIAWRKTLAKNGKNPVVRATINGAVRPIMNVEQIWGNAVIRARQPVAPAISPMHLGRKHA
jgi:hypothetical protein